MSLSGSETLKSAAAICGCSDDDLARFSEHLQALTVHEAARINPFAFAESTGIAFETTLDVFDPRRQTRSVRPRMGHGVSAVRRHHQ